MRSPPTLDGESSDDEQATENEDTDYDKNDNEGADLKIMYEDHPRNLLNRVRQTLYISKELDSWILTFSLVRSPTLASIVSLYMQVTNQRLLLSVVMTWLTNHHWFRLRLQAVTGEYLKGLCSSSIQRILEQFNLNFWIARLGTITAFAHAEEGEPTYEEFLQLYNVMRAKRKCHEAGCRLIVGRRRPEYIL
ncbi:hypothetical protein L3X38_026494 [Prunus dulcis]|uniref:Uncharacterized protein n=1 Tax=Prunus dulcis TaxID=3755 RepID=A0AAD4Z097_PRUDU|nr:hypothetical protein L3X38_026494 [Prunus dulcis]